MHKSEFQVFTDIMICIQYDCSNLCLKVSNVISFFSLDVFFIGLLPVGLWLPKQFPLQIHLELTLLQMLKGIIRNHSFSLTCKTISGS